MDGGEEGCLSSPSGYVVRGEHTWCGKGRMDVRGREGARGIARAKKTGRLKKEVKGEDVVPVWCLVHE